MKNSSERERDFRLAVTEHGQHALRQKTWHGITRGRSYSVGGILVARRQDVRGHVVEHCGTATPAQRRGIMISISWRHPSPDTVSPEIWLEDIAQSCFVCHRPRGALVTNLRLEPNSTTNASLAALEFVQFMALNLS